jgi:sugar phosphate isomerase/epimerase
MDRRHLLKLVAGSTLAAPLAAQLAVPTAARAAVPSALRRPGGPAPGHYRTGAYDISMSLYCFNQNIGSWIKGRTKGAPPLSTMDAISWAKTTGFDAVDITAYYFPGYDTHTMPTLPADQITAFAKGLRRQCDSLNLPISGTGVFNDFADPDDARRALDVQRTNFWTDIAAVMGAPAIRVFSGVVPADLDAAGGWEAVTRTRIVPALREVTAHAATKGVGVLLQNHGDMTATAEQTIQMLEWVGDPNISIIDDTGYFRPFQAPDGRDYDWYRDIAEVLPYSDSIQVKQSPAGEDVPDVPTDYQRLFTGMRLSGYRQFVPLERLWAKDAPDNPKNQPAPPYTQVAAFFADVKAAVDATRNSPFSELANSVRAFGRSGDLGRLTGQLLTRVAQDAGHQYDIGTLAAAIRDLQVFLAVLASAPADISTAAAQALRAQAGSLQVALTDVAG